VPLFGLLYAWRRRKEAVGRYALVLVAASLALYVPYLFQGTRFMSGAGAVLAVLGSVWLADFFKRLTVKCPNRGWLRLG